MLMLMISPLFNLFLGHRLPGFLGGEGAAEAADEAVSCLPDAVLGHRICAEPFKIHVSVDGVNELVIRTNPPENLFSIFSRIIGHTLIIVNIHGDGERLGEGGRPLLRQSGAVFEKFPVLPRHILDTGRQSDSLLDENIVHGDHIGQERQARSQLNAFQLSLFKRISRKFPLRFFQPLIGGRESKENGLVCRGWIFASSITPLKLVGCR